MAAMMPFPAPAISLSARSAQKTRPLQSVSYSEGATIDGWNLETTYKSKIDRSNL